MLLLLLAGQSATALLDTYHAKTQAVVTCDANADPGDVTVCGRRAADRYRVPLVEATPGDPATQDVPAERERLLARTNNCEEKNAFLVECGSVGVTAVASFGPDGLGPPNVRPIAP